MAMASMAFCINTVTFPNLGRPNRLLKSQNSSTVSLIQLWHSFTFIFLFQFTNFAHDAVKVFWNGICEFGQQRNNLFGSETHRRRGEFA